MSAPRRQNVSPKARELIERIYAHHGAGCCWHVVLDDGNWDCIEWVRESIAAGKNECITKGACAELAALDVTASILSRAKRSYWLKKSTEREALWRGASP